MEEMLPEIEKIANTAANTIASPNWADKLTLIISIITAIIATVVTWKQIKITAMQNIIALKQSEISDQQNKIALFEKRYKVYSAVNDVLNIASDESHTDQADRICSSLQKQLKRWQKSDVKESEGLDILSLIPIEVYGKLEQSEFLFSQDIWKEIIGLCHDFIAFSDTAFLFLCYKQGIYGEDEVTVEELSIAKMKFCKSAENFYHMGIPNRMKMDLQLQSIKLEE